jgi:hypothetical protein
MALQNVISITVYMQEIQVSEWVSAFKGVSICGHMRLDKNRVKKTWTCVKL